MVPPAVQTMVSLSPSTPAVPLVIHASPTLTTPFALESSVEEGFQALWGLHQTLRHLLTHDEVSLGHLELLTAQLHVLLDALYARCAAVMPPVASA